MDYDQLAPIVQKSFQNALDKSKNRFGKPVNATGRLRNSIKVAPLSDGLEVSMNEYGLFINDGTRPSKYAGSVKKGSGRSEMIADLLVWIDAKSIRPRFGTKLGLAIGIRNSIWKNGLKANHWIDNVLNDMLKDNSPMMVYLTEIGYEDLEEEVIKIFENLEGI